MATYVNRWTVSLGWMTVMGFVWAIFVPAHLSGLLFAGLALAGLFVSMFGSALVADSQAPESVTAILAKLESDATARPSHLNR